MCISCSCSSSSSSSSSCCCCFSLSRQSVEHAKYECIRKHCRETLGKERPLGSYPAPSYTLYLTSRSSPGYLPRPSIFFLSCISSPSFLIRFLRTSLDRGIPQVFLYTAGCAQAAFAVASCVCVTCRHVILVREIPHFRDSDLHLSNILLKSVY